MKKLYHSVIHIQTQGSVMFIHTSLYLSFGIKNTVLTVPYATLFVLQVDNEAATLASGEDTLDNEHLILGFFYYLL